MPQTIIHTRSLTEVVFTILYKITMVEVFLILTMMVLLPIIIKIGVILFVEAAPMVEGIQAIMEDVEDRAEVVVVL